MPGFTGFALTLVAWGSMSFGAVYPWAYWPLFGAAAVVGLLGWFGARSRSRLSPHGALTLALLAIALAVVLQLLPLPRGVLATLSPSTDALLRQYDVRYAAGALGAHPLSIQPGATWLGLAGLLALGAFWLGTARALSRTSAVGVAHGIVVLGLVLALIGIIQKATGAESIYGFWRPQHNWYQIFGPFVNRNHFAGWMIMALSVALGVLCAKIARAMRDVRPDWRSRLLWLSSAAANQLVLVAFAILVMGLSLVMTLSRSGIICFAGTLGMTGWFVFRKRARGSARGLLAGGYLALLAFVTFSWAGIDPVVNRFASAPTQTLSGRLGAWRTTVHIARDFPVSGTGLNTYGTAMLFYEPADAKAHWDAAHNDYLQLAAEGGLLVGLPAVAVLSLFVQEIRRRFRERADDTTTHWLRVGAVTGLVAIALQELVDFSLQIPGNAALFSVLAAIAVHVPDHDSRTCLRGYRSSARSDSSSVSRRRRGWTLRSGEVIQ